MPCCVTCIDESHDNHSMCKWKSISKQAESLYAKFVDVFPRTKSSYNYMTTEYEDYVQSMNSTLTALRCQFQSVRMAFDEMEASMIEPLVKEIDEVRRIHSDHEQQFQHVECLKHLYESTQKDGHLEKAIFFANFPSFESLNFGNHSFPEAAEFEPAQLNIPNAEDIIGSLIRYDDEPSQVDVKNLRVLSLKSIDTLCLDDRVLPTKDGTKWIISDAKQIKCEISKKDILKRATVLSTLNKDMKRLEVLSTKDATSTYIKDASIIPPSDIVYTDSDKRQVWRVSVHGHKRLVVDTSPVTPNGICFTRNKRLVLGLSEPWSNGRSLIRMYHLENLRSIFEIENDEQWNRLFSSIEAIFQNPRDDFIVHDDNNLLCVSKQGCLRWKIKKDFRHYCIDKFCNIVVATENEIRVLDANGKFLKTLLTNFDFLTTPTSLFVDTDDLLWIGQGNSTKVVKYCK
ncbi:hypothetical protein FSP39_005096 [Pinctada imbricata]|uniref:Tripartite motif-containing protein 2 n=1 Tax=Pinctada imbricata TaxID=66713 RepID=A0AA88YJ23_PINIB|nr:hypothetical protein FSP39_005096 [Pinctada imbricata]